MPLPPGLNARVGARFLERDLHGPAPHEPFHHLSRGVSELHDDQGLRRKLVLAVSNQEPPNGNKRQAAMIPHCCIGADLCGSRLAAVSVGDRQSGPTGLQVTEHRLQRGAPRAFLMRSAQGPGVIMVARPIVPLSCS